VGNKTSESIHSFVIRMWQEEAATGIEKPLWRGHITHFPSERKHHFNQLNQIKEFIILILRDQDDKAEELKH
jgi:hypothetical protein